ncbi:toxin [Aeromonas veronii]|uniref:glycosyl hydrolase family 18 protein n=1 Tax=Aeromonas veronii TaxID=654 RepID=UPI00207CF635|nr:glycosyl hydrolase family 18 protein [Aeromonas veronii]MCO4173861.1 toxin [Aeromonas veronii]
MKKVIVEIIAITALSSSAMAAQKTENTAYYLSGQSAQPGTSEYYATLDNLEGLSNQIVGEKSSFNKLVLSFVQPSLFNYTSNDLSCTGLFGYTCGADKTSQESDHVKSMADFSRLKGIVSSLKQSGVDTYIAVGGWNFSCIPEYYDATANKVNACGPAGEVYDSFPNPNSPDRFDNPATAETANLAYRNIVKLANDLGVAGIDLDYEEFWHADLNAYSWKLTPDNIQLPDSNVEYITTSQLSAMGKSGLVYDDNMQVNPGSEAMPRMMEKTEDKFSAIMESIYTSIDAINPELKLSAAAPATGGIPNMSANWGINGFTTYTYGGAWWGGNLNGLIYNTALRYPDLINRLSSIGIMSYDLSETDCGGETNIPCDLAGQVDFYYSSFINWLKSGDSIRPGHAIVKGSPTYANASLQPQKMLITPSINVGFEVGRPATGGLILTKEILNTIANKASKYAPSGMIMWDLYKDKRHDEPSWGWDETWARPVDVLKTTCEAMGLEGSDYDCSSEIPH